MTSGIPCKPGLVLIAAAILSGPLPLPAADHPGRAVYDQHCVRCHGTDGAGTADVPDPLVGDRSVNQLADSIEETMPQDDPSLVTGEAARQVAEYIHGAFYSAVARDRNHPPRVAFSRLTVRQYRNTVADLIGSFRGLTPAVDSRRGLHGEYFLSRDFDRARGLVFERVDPQVDFSFGLEGPDPERFHPNRFGIRWSGSIVPPETGTYEFVIRTEHSARLALNASRHGLPLINATVRSGDGTEYRAHAFLLGGRAYPVRLEFSKASRGVPKNQDPTSNASISLLWRPPHEPRPLSR